MRRFSKTNRTPLAHEELSCSTDGDTLGLGAVSASFEADTEKLKIELAMQEQAAIDSLVVGVVRLALACAVADAVGTWLDASLQDISHLRTELQRHATPDPPDLPDCPEPNPVPNGSGSRAPGEQSLPHHYHASIPSPAERVGTGAWIFTLVVEQPDKASHSVSKRYSDFKRMHKLLLARSGRGGIPPLPPKRSYRIQHGGFAEKRRAELDRCAWWDPIAR